MTILLNVQLMYCVASSTSFGRGNIDVTCIPVCECDSDHCIASALSYVLLLGVLITIRTIVMPYIKIRLMSPDIDNEIFIQLERGYLMLKNEL